jgi:hypothetical protein
MTGLFLSVASVSKMMALGMSIVSMNGFNN